MAQTVVIHRPGVPGSTMRVTAKAYRAAYASDGYVEGVQAGDSTPQLDHHHRADVARNDAQVAALQEQLRQVQAERDAIAAQHAAATIPAPAPALAAAPPAPPAPPRTDNPPAKRAPRKRTRPTKAAAAPAQAPDPAAMVGTGEAPTLPPSPGPADIGSAPALD